LIHNDGIYEVLIKIKGYPYLKHTERKNCYDIFEVREIMSEPVVTLREKERAVKLVKLLSTYKHNGFPIVDRQGRFKGLVGRKQIVALIECGIFERLSPEDDVSLDSSRGSDTMYSPKPGMYGMQGLMHWAFHIKDDRYSGYSGDIPQAEDLDDDEFGNNGFLLTIQSTMKDVGGADRTPKKTQTKKRSSFLNPSLMQKMDCQANRITLGGDDAMPVINAAKFAYDEKDETGDEEGVAGDTTEEIRGIRIPPENRHHKHNVSLISTATTDSTMVMTNSVQSAPTGFARIGKTIDGDVIVSWLNPAHQYDVVNLEAVMNQGAYCVPEYFPVSKVYRLFTQLGLRWIVVVGGDTGGEVVGKYIVNMGRYSRHHRNIDVANRVDVCGFYNFRYCCEEEPFGFSYL
jgi:CBS domain-containing protein